MVAQIRQQDSRTPVLMLTARGEESDVVAGLELGADDYLPKPVSRTTLEKMLRQWSGA